jgi:Protein of unknown function (DUF4197)
MNKHIFVVIAIISLSSSNINGQIKKKRTIAKPKISTTTSSTTTSSSSSSTAGSESSTIDGIVGTLGGMLGGGSNSNGSGTMTNDLAAKGLKEALNLGTSAATNNLGQIDGFLANAAVKILMPPEAKKLESTLRSLGMGAVCDQVITSVNRAAEGAVVEAKPIFLAAITQMTLTDAISILTGGPDAATQYLKRTSGQALMEKFEPIIQSNLQRTQATQYWSQAMTAYNAVPFGQKINPNLSQYVTQKATEGIFLMVAEEEKKIRLNPLDRVGGIIKDVFGWADKNK